MHSTLLTYCLDLGLQMLEQGVKLVFLVNLLLVGMELQKVKCHGLNRIKLMEPQRNLHILCFSCFSASIKGKDQYWKCPKY